MATKTVYIIVGFDADGNAVEIAQCEPSNPIAEDIMAQYNGPLVNLHWVTRDVENTPTMPPPAPETQPELPEETPYIAPP